MTFPIKLHSIPFYTGYKVLEGVRYSISIRWNTYTEKWYADFVSNDIALRGIALICGKDLFGPYGYRNLLGTLFLVDNSGKNQDPGFAEMGSRWTLEYTPLS